MLFDADVLIWYLRGNAKAAKRIEAADVRHISVITYMELLQGARDKQEVRIIKKFLTDFAFRMLPATENIGHRASIYVEEYGLKGGLGVADVLLAATAVESGLPLCTANDRHYKQINELDPVPFRP
jgi:predicted nucleic acid-binding protein